MLELFHDLHNHIFDENRLPVAAAALLAVCVIGFITGPLAYNAVPVFWRFISALFGGAGSKMDKSGRPAQDLIMRGFILSVVVMAFSFLIGRVAFFGSQVWPNYRLLEGLFLIPLLTGGTLWHSLLRVKRALESEQNVKGAFRTIALTSRTDLLQNDDFTITRTGMGLAVRLFDKAAVAPLFWYLIGGLPVAYLYAGLAAFAWRFGHDGHGKFAGIALGLEKLMGFVPSILAGFLVAAAALFTPTAQMSKSLRGVKAAPYDEGGWPLSAAAYGMQVTLGGASRDLDGVAIHREWVGPPGATAQLGPGHIHRALYLAVFAHFLWLAALIGAIVVSGNNLLTF